MNLEPRDRRRDQRQLEQTAANRQTAIVKLQPFETGETAGNVFHIKFADNVTYPATAGSQTLTYNESTRKELCWADPSQFAVGDMVIAVNEGNRWYAVAKID